MYHSLYFSQKLPNLVLAHLNYIFIQYLVQNTKILHILHSILQNIFLTSFLFYSTRSLLIVRLFYFKEFELEI